jgi:hypothetical protein
MPVARRFVPVTPSLTMAYQLLYCPMALDNAFSVENFSATGVANGSRTDKPPTSTAGGSQYAEVLQRW